MKNWLTKNLPLTKLKQIIIKNKKLCLLLLAVLICVIFLVWRSNQWVMKVNDQKIGQEEYAFYQKINPNLKEDDLQKQIIEDKVQLQQAKKMKIETIDDYAELVKEMKKVNQENEKKIQKKQVIYGLRKYSEETFYDYSLSNVINQLKEKKGKRISAKAVKSYYNKNKKDFKAIDSKELYRVQSSKAMIEELASKPIDLTQIEGDTNVNYEKVVLNESELRNWLKYRDDELQVVDTLKPNTWSTVFGDKSRAWSYYCLSSQEGTILPLAEVQESIKIKLEKEQYQAEVKKWTQQADVESKLGRKK